MPALIASAWTTVHPVRPYVWSCSYCEAVFDVGPLRHSSLTKEQVDGVNLQFDAHCKQVHPRSLPVIGLNTAS
jgi:hypothetical protein